MGRRWLMGMLAVMCALCGCSGRREESNVVVQNHATENTHDHTTALTFPVTLSDSPLIAERLQSYEGPYWEDGSGDYVENVAGLMVHNPTDRMIEFASIAIRQGGEQLYFFIYRLPPNSRCLVLEYQRKPCVPQTVTACRELCIRWGSQEFSGEHVDYVGLGPLMTIINRDSRQLDHVTVWYKQYVKTEDYYLGGKAYSAHLFSLESEGRRTLQPEHYHTDNARIVGIELK